jgi:hypothetical protein
MPKQQQPGNAPPDFLMHQPMSVASGVGKGAATNTAILPQRNGNGNHQPAAMASDPMVEQASQGLEAINILVSERNRMREENEFQRHRIADLEAKLANAEYYHEYFRDKAEHYERFSYGLVSKMGTVHLVIAECQKQALEIGYNEPVKTPVPDAAPLEPAPEPPATLEELEANRLRDLASQLER